MWLFTNSARYCIVDSTGTAPAVPTHAEARCVSAPTEIAWVRLAGGAPLQGVLAIAASTAWIRRGRCRIIRRMASTRFAIFVLASVSVACATGEGDGDETALADTSATNPSTTNPSTTNPSTTDPVTTDPVTTAVDDSSSDTTSPMPDVPAECVDGELDCPCDMDGMCIAPLVCDAATTTCIEPVVCNEDVNEPNDFDSDATALGEISDDPADSLPIEGVLDGPDDADWFTYHGTDAVGSTVAPSTTLMLGGGSVEVCQFFTCDEGNPQVICPPGTAGAMEGFMNGCCAMQGFVFEDEGVECIAGAFNTAGTVYVRIQGATEQCIDYEGTLAFGVD